MYLVEAFTQSVVVLAGIILIGLLFRVRGVFNEGHSALFARVVTEITLPAVIFTALAVHKIDLSEMGQPLVFAGIELVCIVLAWGIASLIRLDPPRKGAFILVSSFGSSAFLGYPIIKGLFHGNDAVMSDAVLVSEFGVGVMIFTVGIMIAMYFGKKGMNIREAAGVFLSFLKSPVCMAIFTGMLFSLFFPFKDSKVFETLLLFSKTIRSANTVFVAFTIGVMLKIKNIRSVAFLSLFVCFMKLILKPLLVAISADIAGFSDMGKEVMVIEAAMPSAALCVVFSNRYGCDGELASNLLMVTLLCCMFTMIGVVAVLL